MARAGSARASGGIVEETFPPVPFEGFQPAALTFFRDLAANQDKTWMAEHKSDYERHVKAPLASFIAALGDRFAEEGLTLRGDPARSVFRLNRDVRFSKNKEPYKTHASAVLSRDGAKQSPGLLYFHLDPIGSFVASGFYQSEPDVLQRMRKHLVEHAETWKALEADLEKAGLPLDKTDTLVRPPKGFEATPAAVMSAVKLKSWIVRRDLTQKQVQSSDLVERVVAFALSASPLLAFGWSAIDHR